MKIQRLLLCLIITSVFIVTMMPLASAATPGEVNAAIDDGLAYLATQQNADGSFGGSGGGAYTIGETGEAVLAFENNGNLPGSGTAYSGNVEKGLDYLFTKAATTAIGVQPAGNPDTNGDGLGVYIACSGEDLYCTGIAAMAIVGSNTPDRVVTTGPLAGQTYKQVLTNMVDYFAWAQNDVNTGNSRGGWRYGANYGSSDNSVSQWPVLALISAEQWGINAPAFVKTELNFWVTYIQNPNGCSGYSSPGDWQWYSYVARTGSLLVEMYYLGDTAATPRVQLATTCINTNWELGGQYGNKGDYYAMYAVFKGLALLGITTLPGPGDWHGDYDDWLLAAQQPAGGWPQDQEWGSSWLDTAWAILILQKTILPVEVTVTFPVCDELEVDYSVGRLTVDGTLTIYKDGIQFDQVTLTGFTGAATYTKAIESGTHTYKAVLDVTTAEGLLVTVERTGTSETCPSTGVPEFPSLALPAGMILGIAFVVYSLRVTKKD
jgi:hypothetical protein